VSIKLETVDNPKRASYDDDPTVINLVKKSLYWESKSLILVSDDMDDDQEDGGIGIDDQPDDRSHKIQLGGSVRVSELTVRYAAAPNKVYSPNFKIPVRVKSTISVIPVVLNDSNSAGGNFIDLDDELLVANERLAQIGVQVKFVDVKFPQLVPQGLGGDSTVTDTIVRTTLRDDAKKMIDAYGTPTKVTDVHAFYVRSVVHRVTPESPASIVGGYALWGGVGNYGNNIFINANRKKTYTLAHEIFHICSKKGHYNPIPFTPNHDYGQNASSHKTSHNLMRDGTSQTPEFGGSKRLYEETNALQETWGQNPIN
jgi:hypothetical protein